MFFLGMLVGAVLVAGAAYELDRRGIVTFTKNF